MKHVTLILLAVFVVALSSCSYVQRQFFSQKTEDARSERKKELPPLYLGTVHQVYPAQKFALLRIIGPMPRAGVTLISHPADDSVARMGNLVVSPDSSPNRGIVVADIRSGAVESGDRVFLYRTISRQTEMTEQTDVELDDVVTETPLPPSGGLNVPPGVRPAASENALPTPAAPEKSQLPAAPVSQPPAPATMPQSPLRQPSMPKLPEKAPTYLNDIPDDINLWD